MDDVLPLWELVRQHGLAGGVVVFALGTFRWLLKRGDDLRSEGIEELRAQRDEWEDRYRNERRDRAKAETLLIAYRDHFGPLPADALTGELRIADVLRHIAEEEHGVHVHDHDGRDG